MDEKWSFVNRKEANCDPEDPESRREGDHWDHTAVDPETRLVLAVVPGKRTAENTKRLTQEVQRRTDPVRLELITTDEYSAYKGAIQEVFGELVTPPRTGRRGRPKAPYRVSPPRLNYATVHKTREKGRVIKVETRVIFGSDVSVKEVLKKSTASRHINTSFVERQNGTDRHFNARKHRKTCCFSKDWDLHEAATYFIMYQANFCWAVRTLRVKNDKGRWSPRTPAMAAGLADHVWSLSEWLRFPAVQRS